MNINDSSELRRLIGSLIDPLVLFTDSYNKYLIQYSRKLSSLDHYCLKLFTLNLELSN